VEDVNGEMDRSIETSAENESEAGRLVVIGLGKKGGGGIVDNGIELDIETSSRTSVLDEISKVLS
jgi:hypothetical protein